MQAPQSASPTTPHRVMYIKHQHNFFASTNSSRPIIDLTHLNEYRAISSHHVPPLLHQPHQSRHVLRFNRTFLVKGPQHGGQGPACLGACAWVSAIVRFRCVHSFSLSVADVDVEVLCMHGFLPMGDSDWLVC